MIWNEFMRKRGWNDKATETLNRRKRESGLSDRDDIRTMFAQCLTILTRTREGLCEKQRS